MRKQIVLLVVLLSAQVSHGGELPRINGNSLEEFKKSLELVGAPLDEEKKRLLKAAMHEVTMKTLGDAMQAALAGNDVPIDQLLMKTLNGMTAVQIIGEGGRLALLRVAKKIEANEAISGEKQGADKQTRLLAELRALEAKAKLRDKAQVALRRFRVLTASFAWKEIGYSVQPTIELAIQNDLSRAVSKAYFKGILVSPGRSVPWVDESFNYKISGGVEPGEKVKWQLAPNMFGEWGKAPKDRTDLELRVIPFRVDGPDGKPLYDASALTEFDRERLEQLRKRLKK